MGDGAEERRVETRLACVTERGLDYVCCLQWSV